MSTLDSLNTPSPTRLLDKVELVGHPFHGLVHSGALTLPNDDTLIYRQPSSADAWAIHLAGVPALTRTPEELSADAALGHQWLHRVVLSGDVPQVYGKQMSGAAPAWLFRDVAGVVWQFSLPRLATYQTALRVTRRMFGRFGAPAPAAVDIDLSHAVDDGAVPLDLSTTVNTELPDTVVRVCDISADGSSVIVGLFRDPRRTLFSGYGTPIYRLPDAVDSALGFVRIDVDGSGAEPVLSLATLRNHRAVLGTVGASSVRVPAGDWQDLPMDESNSYRVGTVTYDDERTVSGRIVSMYFDDSTVREVTLSRSIVVSTTRDFGLFTEVVPGHGSVDFFYKETNVLNDFVYALHVDGVSVASMNTGGTLIGAFTSSDIAGFVTDYSPGDVNYSFHRDAAYVITPYEAPSEASQLVASREVPQTGYWAYSKKLFCIFRITAGGTVHWSDAFAPGASATAQPPLGGVWTPNVLGYFDGGPAAWYRAQDPITGAISDAHSSTVCFV